MFKISSGSPAYYLTSVTKDRLPVFRSDKMKAVAALALDEARTSCGFLIFAYVIMPDHIHLITDSRKKPEEILRYVNGIVARRVIDFLKRNNYISSLEKLRHQDRGQGYRYSLWDHHPNIRQLTSESMLMQRVHYTHQNPVRARLVENAEDYQYSSVRFWNRRPREDEPLLIDIDKIHWRKRI